MTDGQLQPSEGHSKGFFKDTRKRFKKLFSGSSSRSTFPQPSASGQENRDGELSVQHPNVSSGRQWIDPVIGPSSQQGIFHASLSLDKALSPAYRLSHTIPVINITAILLKARPIRIYSGFAASLFTEAKNGSSTGSAAKFGSWTPSPKFETLKAYGTR